MSHLRTFSRILEIFLVFLLQTIGRFANIVIRKTQTLTDTTMRTTQFLSIFRKSSPPAPQHPAQATPYVPLNVKTASAVGMVLVVTNLFTYTTIRPAIRHKENARLYLLDKASVYVPDLNAFEHKVRQVSTDLDIPPEWLMAVMYSESRFDASAVNLRGSGAVGLIQWMPATAADYSVSTHYLRQLDHIRQLDYVYEYLDRVRRKYGPYKSLTELYLAILFPKALNQDYCFTMYAKPTKAYVQNTGLDENKDGRVTVSDIDKRMQRVFPTAYITYLQR